MDNKTRSIHIFLLDGEPEGIRSARIPLHSIIGIAFKGVQLGLARKAFDKDLGRSGVYVLMGQQENGKLTAYIGESEKIWERLQQQSNKKPEEASVEWTEAFVFVSEDETLTKGHVRFAEAELIKAAKENPHWHIPNQTNPVSDGRLPKPDEYFMREFVEQVKMLAGALGCTVFKSVSGKPKQASLFNPEGATPVTESIDVQQSIFRMTGDGYLAKMVVYPATGELSVIKGSTVKKTISDTTPPHVKDLREKLLADGVVRDVAGVLEFTMDYGFSSASTAASFIAGNSVNGTKYWKLASNPAMNFGQWKDAQNNAASPPL